MLADRATVVAHVHVFVLCVALTCYAFTSHNSGGSGLVTLVVSLSLSLSLTVSASPCGANDRPCTVGPLEVGIGTGLARVLTERALHALHEATAVDMRT